MTLRYITSFEQLPGDLNTSGSLAMLNALGFSWGGSGVYWDAPAGRRAGTKALQAPQYGTNGNECLEWTLPGIFGMTTGEDPRGFGECTLLAGFAYKPGTVNPTDWTGNPFIAFYDPAGGYLGGIDMSVGGRAQVVDSSNLGAGSRASTSPFTSTSAWNYCEVSMECTGNVAPNVTFKVDGVTQCSAAIGGSKNVSKIRIQWSRAAGYPSFDDFYLCDSNGSVNNSFLGDCRVEYLEPTAAGAEQNWQLGAGASHLAAVTGNDVTDAGYIRNPARVPETFILGDLAVTPSSILGVQVSNIAQKESGPGRLGGAVRISGTTYNSTVGTIPLSGVYRLAPGIFEQNPDTGSDWTAAAINAMEAGPVVIDD